MIKLPLYKLLAILNSIYILYFLIWYFFFDGYLGFGYGELVYILIIIIVLLICMIVIFSKRNLKNFKIGIYLLLLMFNIWFFYLLCTSKNIEWCLL